jgi:DNA-binding NtrC family response regulator
MTDQVRILIVDDEPAVRTALKLAIRRRPWQVEEVESAEAALTRLEVSRFDAALIDKNLPVMTGIELIREIRKTNQSMAIMVITGFASSESATESLHLGIDAYLEKPFDNVYKVASKLEDILVERQRRRQSGELAAVNEHFCRALDALEGKSKKTKGTPELRILVVSPIESEGEWFVKQFQSNTIGVIHVSSSSEALKYCTANPDPHIVIVDATIQDPEVVQFVEKMKRLVPEVNFIVVAEKSPLHLRLIMQLIALGVRVLLEKPLDSESLRKKLEYIAGRLRLTARPSKRTERRM